MAEKTVYAPVETNPPPYSSPGKYFELCLDKCLCCFYKCADSPVNKLLDLFQRLFIYIIEGYTDTPGVLNNPIAPYAAPEQHTVVIVTQPEPVHHQAAGIGPVVARCPKCEVKFTIL